jgi:hypothetical protein
MIMQVGKLEEHSTMVGQYSSVTVTQPKFRLWTASGVKRFEIWRQYNMCVVRLCFWYYYAKANSKNSEARISYSYLGPETET